MDRKKSKGKKEKWILHVFNWACFNVLMGCELHSFKFFTSIENNMCLD
jgi:hypothetical protein